MGIAVNWGYQLEALQQDDDGVSVAFANGVQESFSFVIGCDGLRSSTRESLFGEQPVHYTGLSMVRSVLDIPVLSDVNYVSGAEYHLYRTGIEECMSQLR